MKELSDLSSNAIPWLNTSILSDNNKSDSTCNVAAFMKTSDSVGSLVNASVNGITSELQRVVSPCQCEFEYVSLDPELDPFAEEFEATQYMVCCLVFMHLSRLNLLLDGTLGVFLSEVATEKCCFLTPF